MAPRPGPISIISLVELFSISSAILSIFDLLDKKF